MRLITVFGMLTKVIIMIAKWDILIMFKLSPIYINLSTFIDSMVWEGVKMVSGSFFAILNWSWILSQWQFIHSGRIKMKLVCSISALAIIKLSDTKLCTSSRIQRKKMSGNQMNWVRVFSEESVISLNDEFFMVNSFESFHLADGIHNGRYIWISSPCKHLVVILDVISLRLTHSQW